MRSFLMTLHILTCISLVVVVLLQRGKGADMGAAFGGGGANTVFGARGAGNFLTRITTGAAVIFMVTSLSLSYLATQDSQVQIFDDEIEAPLEGDPALLEEIDGGVPSDAGAASGLEAVDDAASSGALVEIETVPAPGSEEPSP